MTSRFLRHALVPATAALATLVLATGCGPSAHDDTGMADHHHATASSRPGATHNAADAMFARMMVPHHRQAVEMAALVPDRAADPALVRLAARIGAAQRPEIDTLSGWLRSWGETTDDKTMDGEGTDGAMTGDGMVSDADLKRLKAVHGTAFDRLFARLMIAHHTGAIAMARDEQRDGRNPDAVALAGRIVRDQSAEITTLRSMLDGT